MKGNFLTPSQPWWLWPGQNGRTDALSSGAVWKTRWTSLIVRTEDEVDVPKIVRTEDEVDVPISPYGRRGGRPY